MSTAKPGFTQLPEAMEVADVGPYLKSLREHYRLSVNDVAHRLHIRPKYIESMEISDFDSMPSKVYARGYVSSYAEFLGVNPVQTVEVCFGTKPLKKDDFFMPRVAKKTPPRMPKAGWLALAGCAFIAAVWFDYQSVPADPAQPSASVQVHDVESESTVSAVPEDMLMHTRQLLMPTRSAYRCLVQARSLACRMAATKTLPPKRSMVDAQFITPFMWLRG